MKKSLKSSFLVMLLLVSVSCDQIEGIVGAFLGALSVMPCEEWNAGIDSDSKPLELGAVNASIGRPLELNTFYDLQLQVTSNDENLNLPEDIVEEAKSIGIEDGANKHGGFFTVTTEKEGFYTFYANAESWIHVSKDGKRIDAEAYGHYECETDSENKNHLKFMNFALEGDTTYTFSIHASEASKTVSLIKAL